MKRIFLHPEAGKGDKGRFACISRLIFTGLLVLFLSIPASSQDPFEVTSPGHYRLEFINKENNPYSLNAPGEFLSQKSLSRRQKQNIQLSFTDLPVSPAYLDSVRSTGATILSISKWFNAVTVSAGDSILEKLAALTILKKNPLRKTTATTITGKRQLKEIIRLQGTQALNGEQVFDYGTSGWQTAIHKGQVLHNLGYTGEGMTIAVIDAGFYHVDQLPAFSSLWERSRILGTRDFVMPGGNLFNGHSHGMVVLSIIAGNLPGDLIGTSPDASFWLLRSEDTGSEYVIEEDNWTSAAEFADSAGADIISSSLGYSEFDDPAMSHSYADMDGNSTRVSRAADMAASKGMLVVVSAGNQGAGAWHYISAPADADSVISVGAVDANGYIAGFSSRGPSSDLRVKPDVVAIGEGTWMSDLVSGVRQGNGTSLSAPVIAGLAACLWQADPGATAMEVAAAIRESGDRFTGPDDDFGYGIPNFSLAHSLLRQRQSGSPDGIDMVAFPNPFSTELYILFPSGVDGQVDVNLIDLSGRVVMQASYPQFEGRSNIVIDKDLAQLNKGVYFLKVSTGSKISISKLIKF